MCAISLIYFSLARSQFINFPDITNSGLTLLGGDVNKTIHIEVSNVTFDMQGHFITANNGIEIEPNLHDITIINGVIDASNIGLNARAGCSNIALENMTFCNGLEGIHFEQVSNALIKNCEMSSNTTGLSLVDSYNVVVQNCIASANIHAGFDLISSTTNMFEDCKALSTGQGNTNSAHVGIYGFVSRDGYGNIFENCIANATQGLTVTGFDSVVAGFALQGSERNTKIITCEAANSRGGLTGSAGVYGIVAQERTVDPIVSTTGALGINGSVSSISWSPDGKFIAIAGTTAVSGGSGQEIQIFSFDYTDESMAFAAGVSLDGTVGAIEWSPYGNYLAVGTITGSLHDLAIYEFDPILKQLSFVTQLPAAVASVRTVSWSPDATRIAIGIDDTYALRLYRFDQISQTLTLLDQAIAGGGTVFSVAWSPDGFFVAVGGSSLVNGQLQLFRLSESTQKLISVASAFVGAEAIISVSWSHCGTYIAVCGNMLTANNVQIFSFNPDSFALQLKAGAYGTSSFFRSIDWSADDRYIVAAANSLAQRIQLAGFDSGLNLLVSESSGISAGTINIVSWSPDGQYGAVGGSGLSENIMQIVRLLEFPKKNVIKGNTIYSNGERCPYGIGISGSSIANNITGNTSYNNPINYAYAQNIFNALLSGAPSDVQNIALKGCDAICQPENTNLFIKQILFKVCEPIPSQLDVIESKIDNLKFSFVDTPCAPIAITTADISGGAVSITDSGNYCVAEDLTADILITATCVVLDINGRCITGIVNVQTSDDVQISNGYIQPAAPISAPAAALTIAATTNRIECYNIRVTCADTTAVNIAGRSGFAIYGNDVLVERCFVKAGAAGDSATAGPDAGHALIIGTDASRTMVRNCTLQTASGGSVTGASGDGGDGGRGISVESDAHQIEIKNTIIIGTGNGGDAGAVTGTGGNGGDGIFIASTCIDVSVRDCTIRNTGAGGLGMTASGEGGKAVDDNVTTVTNLSMIYANFAHNIANDIKYDIQAEGLESGILVPNPPTGTVINPLANVFAS